MPGELDLELTAACRRAVQGFQHLITDSCVKAQTLLAFGYSIRREVLRFPVTSICAMHAARLFRCSVKRPAIRWCKPEPSNPFD